MIQVDEEIYSTLLEREHARDEGKQPKPLSPHTLMDDYPRYQASLKTNDVVAETLAWINDQRALLGLKPVKRIRRGFPGTPSQCAIARTLNVGAKHKAFIGASGYWHIDGPSTSESKIPFALSHTYGQLFPSVAAFQQEFDEGKHTRYFKRGWRLKIVQRLYGFKG